MNKKKILWIILLICVIAAIIAAGFIIKNVSFKNNNDSENQSLEKASNNAIDDELNNIIQSNQETKEYTKIVLDDGTLYSTTGEKVESDFVVGTNYFDTTINDIYLNPQSYENKKIEIEGMYLENSPYTFVGRYSTSNLCQNCPAGYSYFEYQLNGKIDEEFKDEDTWIKVIGTLAKGNDATSNFQDYYYLNVISLEIMNQRGQATVVN